MYHIISQTQQTMQSDSDIDDITVALSDNSDDTIIPFNKFSNHITTNHQLDDIVFQRNQTNTNVLCKEHSATSTTQTYSSIPCILYQKIQNLQCDWKFFSPRLEPNDWLKTLHYGLFNAKDIIFVENCS